MTGEVMLRRLVIDRAEYLRVQQLTPPVGWVSKSVYIRSPYEDIFDLLAGIHALNTSDLTSPGHLV